MACAFVTQGTAVPSVRLPAGLVMIAPMTVFTEPTALASAQVGPSPPVTATGPAVPASLVTASATAMLATCSATAVLLVLAAFQPLAQAMAVAAPVLELAPVMPTTAPHPVLFSVQVPLLIHALVTVRARIQALVPAVVFVP